MVANRPSVRPVALVLAAALACGRPDADRARPAPAVVADTDVQSPADCTPHPDQGTDFDAVAWCYFAALNQPLVGGQPKAWEGWRATSTVYLPDGSRPAPWGRTPPPPPAVLQEARKLGLNTSLPFHDLDSDQQVDGLALLDRWRTPVRYQLLMNDATFGYILGQGLYNVNGQAARAARRTPADFPATAFELKTSWIWIGTDPDRLAALQGTYYVVNAYYANPDGSWVVGRAALSGMHVISRALPQWVWTTFENAGNPKFTQVSPELPVSAHVAQLNAAYRKKLAGAGSVFANYELRGSQTAFIDASGAPTRLANSQIESAFQATSSCITCHALASYAPGRGYRDFVKSQGGGIVYYTGDPPPLGDYTSLDFVWSLKRAQWQRSAPADGGARP